MTRKENLLITIYELRNSLSEINGKETTDIAEFSKSYRFHEEVKRWKEYELKERIEMLQKELIRAKAKKEVDAKKEVYLQTEEGKAAFEAKMAKKDELEKAYDSLEAVTRYTIEKSIKQTIGDHWTVKSFSDTSMKIGILGEDGKAIFGQDADIYFEEKAWGTGEQRFEINIGTCGSCPLDEGTKAGSFSRFYIGIGQIFSNAEFLSWLKDTLFGYARGINDIRKQLREIDAWFENPFKA